MQTVSALLFGVCFAAALGGVVRLLSADGSTKRLVRLFTALFVLTTALRPVQTILQSIPGTHVLQNTQAAAEAVRENARLAMERCARRTLDAHGCTQAQIEVRTAVRDGEVVADVFVVRGVPEEKAQEIADEIFTLTGERPVVENAP